MLLARPILLSSCRTSGAAITASWAAACASSAMRAENSGFFRISLKDISRAWVTPCLGLGSSGFQPSSAGRPSGGVAYRPTPTVQRTAG